MNPFRSLRVSLSGDRSGLSNGRSPRTVRFKLDLDKRSEKEGWCQVRDGLLINSNGLSRPNLKSGCRDVSSLEVSSDYGI